MFSVPFDAAARNDTLVTASHAVFHKESGKTTPAAVVGFQFQHSAMHALFRNITESSSDAASASCKSDDYECFIIDDNGYVIVSASYGDTGKFFGDIRGYLMHLLILENVFKPIEIYDYQAICFIAKDPANFATRLLTVSERAEKKCFTFDTYSSMFMHIEIEIECLWALYKSCTMRA